MTYHRDFSLSSVEGHIDIKVVDDGVLVLPPILSKTIPLRLRVSIVLLKGEG
jgi:hypothetical protein